MLWVRWGWFQNIWRKSQQRNNILGRGILLCGHLWVDDQVGDDPMLLQVGVSLLPVPILYLVRSVQVLQRYGGDVDLPGRKNTRGDVTLIAGSHNCHH